MLRGLLRGPAGAGWFEGGKKDGRLEMLNAFEIGNPAVTEILARSLDFFRVQRSDTGLFLIRC